MTIRPSLAELPHDVVTNVALWLLKVNDFEAAQSLSWTCTDFHENLQGLRVLTRMRRHKLRWAVAHLNEDVVLRCRGLRVIGSEPSWRRAYGLPLLPKESTSTWSIRIDRSRRNQGLMLLGVSVQMRTGLYEWCLSPFYGRLFRRAWDMDGDLMCGEPPPAGYPDGHLKHVLVDELTGEPTTLEGRANGAIIEVTVDHDEGKLSFRLNGGPEVCLTPTARRALRETVERARARARCSVLHSVHTRASASGGALAGAEDCGLPDRRQRAGRAPAAPGRRLPRRRRPHRRRPGHHPQQQRAAAARLAAAGERPEPRARPARPDRGARGGDALAGRVARVQPHAPRLLPPAALAATGGRSAAAGRELIVTILRVPLHSLRLHRMSHGMTQHEHVRLSLWSL